MIEVYVESIRVNMSNYKRVVMLKEKAGVRYLPVWIGHFEADAIAIPMQNVPVSRPLTHDFALSAITSVGGKVTQAVIGELNDETFFAKVIVDANGRHVEIDSRPSDAISIAIRAKVPIYVADAVMDTAAMTFDENAPTTPARPDPDAASIESTLAELVESALQSTANAPASDESTEASAADEVEAPPYLPGAEPAAGLPPEPFGEIGPVTEPVRAALQRAITAARRSRQLWIGPGDLMIGLLQQREAAANGILSALSIEADEIQKLIEQEFARDLPAASLTPAAQAVTRRAVEEAERLEEQAVGSEHLLLALAGQPESSVAVALDRLGVSAESIRRQIAVLLTPPPPSETPGETDDA
jgi:bifunctional DNase/RNase